MGKSLQVPEIPYFSDSDLSTPLENAFELQSDNTVFEILKECTNSPQFFISFKDTKKLINLKSSFANNALDRIFQQTKFTVDLDPSVDYFGEIEFQSTKVKNPLQKLIDRFGPEK